MRIATAGSVDDGKSTLIGRLLYDCRAIMADQLEAVQKSSRARGESELNLALITDGLRSEREQGITIDVAYRYFSTPRRKFIVADTPGHVQYTRNMVTGASTADVALVLLDASRGIKEQSRRHTLLSSLLGVPHVVVCVNKMDLVGFSNEVFEQIRTEFTEFADRLRFADLTFIPISALRGDNVVQPSVDMPWYGGPTLLFYLENVHRSSSENLIDVRFPVQLVLTADDGTHPTRLFAGQMASGVLRPGDEVTILPSGFTTTVREISTFDGPVEEAFSPMSVAVQLADEIDIDRGHMLCRSANRPHVTQEIEAMICWMNEAEMQVGRTYSIRHTTRETKARVEELSYKLDVTTLNRSKDSGPLSLNEIGKVRIRTSEPLFVDVYLKNRQTGSFILIDDQTNATLAAGMIQ